MPSTGRAFGAREPKLRQMMKMVRVEQKSDTELLPRPSKNGPQTIALDGIEAGHTVTP